MFSKYPWSDEFESVVLYYCCTDVKFWNNIGRFLVPDELRVPLHTEALKAIISYVADKKRPVPSYGLVANKLSLTQGVVAAHGPAFQREMELVEDAPKRHTADDVIVVVRSMLQTRSVTKLVSDNLSGGELTIGGLIEMGKQAQQVAEIGVAKNAGPQTMDEVIEEYLALPAKDVIETGIGDFDNAIGGGVNRGEMCVWLAPTNGGKSMCLSQQAGAGILGGRYVGAITTELAKDKWLARLIASVTNIPITRVSDMLRDPTQYRRVMGKMKEIFQEYAGGFLIQDMEPGTKYTSIFDFVESAQDKAGRKMDLLVIDYADRLAGWTKDNSYKEMEEVYEGLRVYGEQNQLVVATASQAKRGSKAKWPMDEDDFADSISKGRVVDDVYTINMKKNKDDGSEEFRVYIAKRRNGGNARIFGTEPFKSEWAFGRMAPWSDKFVYKVQQPTAEDLQMSRGPLL